MESIIALMNDGKIALALASVRELLADDEYNIELLELKALLLGKNDQYSEALDVHNILVNLLPSSADQLAERGLCLFKLAEHKAALEDFTKAVELEPENGYRYASRAYIKDTLSDFTGALADYERAIELDPDDAVSYNNKGLVEEKLGRQHLAQESFERADKLAGLEPHTALGQQQSSTSTAPVTTKPRNMIGLGDFFTTIKNLFTSTSERKKFIDFILRRK